MIMWLNNFGAIYLLNLDFREDRKEASTEVLKKFGIPFTLVKATHDKETPIKGLIATIKVVMTQANYDGHSSILVFEDDIHSMVDNETFHTTMNGGMNQLPHDWDLLYLGCNAPNGFRNFHSANLLTVKRAFSTHAVAYSKRAIDFILAHEISEPYDNFLVNNFQQKAKCYCTYPMLMTQKPGMSDIEGKHTDWSMCLEKRYDMEVKKLQV